MTEHRREPGRLRRAIDPDPRRRFVSAEEMTGKPLLVVFWTMPAQPFIRQLPTLQKLLGQIDPQRLNVIGVNLDDDDNESAVQTFLETNGLNWQTIFYTEPDKRGWNNPIATYYGLQTVPMYWLATTVKLGVMVLAGEFVLHARFSLLDTVMSYLFLPTRNSDGNLFPLLGVGWTLNFEMLFYLLFAVALFLRVSVFKFVGTVLFFLAAGALFRQDNWPAVSFYLSPIVLDFFLRHCEERLVRRSSTSEGGSDEAIHFTAWRTWIASLRSQ